MDTPQGKRSSIVAMKENTSMSIRSIAAALQVPKSTVSNVINQYKKTGSIETKRKGKCGRKKKTSPRDDAFLLRESIKYPKKTSHQLNVAISGHGVSIDSSTVRRRLLAAGRPAYRSVKKQLLTLAMKKKRYHWAKVYKGWTAEDWKKVVFTDETHFLVQGQKSRYVRKFVSEQLRSVHLDQNVKHPQKVMFWGSFCYSGVQELYRVEGMMNSDKYINVVDEIVLSNMNKLYPDGSGIFQQDLAPCHTSKKVKEFFSKKGLTVLQWPGNSPDINPIENLWAIIKQRLQSYDCTTLEKLQNAVFELWYNDEKIKENCKKLITSMPNRVQLLLKNHGGHIKY